MTNMSCFYNFSFLFFVDAPSPAPITSYPALFIPRPCLFDFLFSLTFFTIAPLQAKIFPNKLVPNVSSNILRNHPFCSLASFWSFWLTLSNNKPESSRDLTILIMSSVSSFDIISVALCKALRSGGRRTEDEEWCPDPKICLFTPASANDAAAVNPNGIKTLLDNG